MKIYRRLPRQREEKRRALAGFAFQPDLAAVRLHDVLHDRKAEAGAALLARPRPNSRRGPLCAESPRRRRRACARRPIDERRSRCQRKTMRELQKCRARKAKQNWNRIRRANGIQCQGGVVLLKTMDSSFLINVISALVVGGFVETTMPRKDS